MGDPPKNSSPIIGFYRAVQGLAVIDIDSTGRIIQGAKQRNQDFDNPKSQSLSPISPYIPRKTLLKDHRFNNLPSIHLHVYTPSASMFPFAFPLLSEPPNLYLNTSLNGRFKHGGADPNMDPNILQA